MIGLPQASGFAGRVDGLFDTWERHRHMFRAMLEARGHSLAVRAFWDEARLSFVDAVAAEASEMDHHPDIDIRWRTVTFALVTHSEGGITEKDVAMAGEINRMLTT